MTYNLPGFNITWTTIKMAWIENPMQTGIALTLVLMAAWLVIDIGRCCWQKLKRFRKYRHRMAVDEPGQIQDMFALISHHKLPGGSRVLPGDEMATAKAESVTTVSNPPHGADIRITMGNLGFKLPPGGKATVRTHKHGTSVQVDNPKPRPAKIDVKFWEQHSLIMDFQSPISQPIYDSRWHHFGAGAIGNHASRFGLHGGNVIRVPDLTPERSREIIKEITDTLHRCALEMAEKKRRDDDLMRWWFAVNLANPFDGRMFRTRWEDVSQPESPEHGEWRKRWSGAHVRFHNDDIVRDGPIDFKMAAEPETVPPTPYAQGGVPPKPPEEEDKRMSLYGQTVELCPCCGKPPDITFKSAGETRHFYRHDVLTNISCRNRACTERPSMEGDNRSTVIDAWNRKCR